MKKLRLQYVKPIDPPPINPKPSSTAKPVSNKSMASESQRQKQGKKLQLQKEIEKLNAKIGEASSSIQQTAKLLDIDVFLKKQKEKRLEYASKLNEQYEHSRKEREEKLYKSNARSTLTHKLTSTLVKTQIPLSIFRAVDQIRLNDCRLKEWILDDHYHKLDEMLLDTSKNGLWAENMRTEEEKYLKDAKESCWKRAREVASNCTEMKFFPVKIQESQLEPSDAGEALMAALVLMPQELSEVLYSQASDVNREKYFLVRCFAGGQRKSVLTDSWIQVREYVHRNVNVNSRFKNNLSFWSGIMEKAFKKLSYGTRVGSSLVQHLYTIYGIDPQILPFNNINTIKQNFPKIMDSLLKYQPKALIGFINDRAPTNMRIYPLRTVEFPSLNAATNNKKKKQGSSSHPNPQILYRVSNPYSGGVLKSDYTNKFTLNELFQKFNKIVIVRELPARWAGMRISVEFMSNGPISFTGSQWTKNNQYSFSLSKDAHTRIALRRKWGSYTDSQKQSEEDIFGFILFRSQEGQTEISCMKLQGLVCKCRNTDENGCVYSGALQKGTYIVIPYSHTVSQQYMQLFNFDIMVQRDDITTVNKSKINEYYYQSGEVNTHKILQKLQMKTQYYKPKHQKIVAPKLFYKASTKTLNATHIQGLNLTLMKDVTNEDYFIPGKLKHLLVGGQFREEKRQKIVSKSIQSQQVEKYEKQQALKVILGYDVLMDQDINYGEMKEILEQTSDIIDLAGFALGQEGLAAMMEAVMQVPRIVSLNLANNQLNDSSVTYLCYFLEKGGRNELRQLNLTGNSVGKMGVRALRGLCSIFKELKVVGVKL